jgi:CDP-glucose 4,6-dehydratase
METKGSKMEDMVKFWKDKKVLITGHTGFKGAWLTMWLLKMGAKVTGFSSEEHPNDFVFKACNLSNKVKDIRGDLNDLEAVEIAFKQEPEIVFHLAAQALVRESYDKPLLTLNTNIIGTANVLQCIRKCKSVKCAVLITTDKCYENKEWVFGYRENDRLGGHDPYSTSKAGAEMVIKCFRDCFLKAQGKLIASARAGNVIGGGDYAKDRLLTDCINALKARKDIEIRSPKATRPWQHVLEPLSGYLLLAQKMWIEKKYDEAWNFGPDIQSIRKVEEVTEKVVRLWGSGKWVDVSNEEHKHEARVL